MSLLITADTLFDGERFLEAGAVLVRGHRIEACGRADTVPAAGARRIDLGDATLLPGVIDLHTHVSFRGVPFDRILAHGVTTVRDLGGYLPSTDPSPGRPRFVAAGPIITVPGGYPIPVFGTEVAAPVRDPEAARRTVDSLVAGGAGVIKIALEPGGEAGAPWSTASARPAPPWPLPPVELVAAVVEAAHRHGRKVTAHLGEERGVRIALAAGVDEWAHCPADPVPEELLRAAAERGVRIVGTFDTQARTTGQLRNARIFVAHGGRLLYGTDMAHAEIPHGFDAYELLLMREAGLSLEQALAGATSLAGEQLGLAPLGRLCPGAPADLVGVAGDVRRGVDGVKSAEYPVLVVSAGTLVSAPALVSG